jgi:hypothetical protein
MPARCALLLIAASSFAYGQQPTPSLSDGKTGNKTGTISGKVTLKGKAATGVTVGLRVSPQNFSSSATLRATTDSEGNYRITGVPAGSYQVAPAAPAFVSKNQIVVLAEDETAEGIDFALVRGGVITGKVTDADGRPAIEQTVSLIAADPPPNQPPNQPSMVFPVTSVQTDDRGIYRMFGVTAGRYKVYSGRAQNNPLQAMQSARASYNQVFYPNVSDAALATAVEVAEGSEASNIDIALDRPTQTFAASGRILDGQSNQPLSNVNFGVQMISGTMRSFGGGGATSNSRGEFRLENLAPGKYAVMIFPQQGTDVHADPVTFDIIDQDVEGLVVKTSRGASLSGTVVLENTDDKTVLARLLQLWINGYVQTQDPGGSVGHSVAINPDGSFSLVGLDAGTAHLSLGARQDRSVLKGFVVVRTEVGGVSQPSGIQVNAGDQVTGVRLIVHYGNATVYGVVNLINGTLPPGARIFVQVSRAGEVTPIGQSPQVDARGHFLMEGLPGGTYDFTAVVYNPAAGRTPPLRTKQQAVVADGATTNITITVDLSPGSGTPTL